MASWVSRKRYQSFDRYQVFSIRVLLQRLELRFHVRDKLLTHLAIRAFEQFLNHIIGELL